MEQNEQNKTLEELKMMIQAIEALRSELRSYEMRLKRLEEAQPKPETISLEEQPPVPLGAEPPSPPPPEPIPYVPSEGAPRKGYEEKEGKISDVVKGVTGLETPEGVNLEAMMGGNWLVKIGVAAIVIGVGFFLKYAFDHWIGPTGQVVAGILVGLVLLGAGEYWKDRYRSYAQAITGGGIAILYLVFYGAFAFMDPPVIASAYTTFFFMGLVTLTSGILAVRYNSPVIAIMGMVGGYLTPLMLYRNLSENELTLIGYIVLLNFGVLFISAFRNWRPFALIGFLGAHLLFSVWLSDAYAPEKLGIAMYTLTVFFLQFAFVTIIYHLINRKTIENPDVILMGANAAVYFGWSYKLLKPDFEIWLGFFAVGLAFFYFLLAYLAYFRNREDPRLTLTLSGVALVFLTIAIPLQLKQYWITIAWAAEGVVLSWLGFYLRSHHLRAFSLLVFILVIVRLFGFDMVRGARIEEFAPIFNKTFFVFAVSVVAFYLASYMWWLGKDDSREEERYVMPALLLVANGLTLWILSHDLIRYFDARIADVRAEGGKVTIYGNEKYDRTAVDNLQFLKNLSVTMLWALYALALMLAGIIKKYNVIQTAGIALLVLVMAKFVVVDTLGPGRLTLAQNFSLSFIWLVYSIVLIAIGIISKYRPMRVSALAFLWVIVFKVFLFDTWRLAELYRIASYISLGVILLVIGYIYLRFQERIKEFLLE